MIKESSGNLLEVDADALVNTVNTVGVMGKGIALQFKRAFPENFRQYESVCKKKQVKLGEMLVHENISISGPRYVINFPTKNHWKSRSRLVDIESGLRSLRAVIIELKIRSVAVPPLGCGNGGLDWTDVYPLIKKILGDLPDVDILVFPPAGAPNADSMPVRTKRPKMTPLRAALLLAFEHYSRRSTAMSESDTGILSIVEAQKVTYFLQLAGWDSKIEFIPSYFGPYARTVDQFISSVEGHFIRGYGDGSTGSKATLTLDPEALAEAHDVLDGDLDYKRALQRFEEIVNGFEFPYGVELLSTVHYVITMEREPPSIGKVMHSINSWSKRKGELFKEKQALLAYRHLIQTRVVAPEPSVLQNV